MPESMWLFIFAVLVVIVVAIVRRYVIAAANLGALLLTIIACVICAAVDVFLISHSILGFIFAALIIYAGANLIFQIVTRIQSSKP